MKINDMILTMAWLFFLGAGVYYGVYDKAHMFPNILGPATILIFVQRFMVKGELATAEAKIKQLRSEGKDK